MIFLDIHVISSEREPPSFPELFQFKFKCLQICLMSCDWQADNNRFNLVSYGRNKKKQWTQGKWYSHEVSSKSLRKQGLSSSETDMLKPTESRTSSTEPEGQRCELTCRTGAQVEFQKGLSNKKGTSCPFAVSGAWLCPLWFFFFLCPCTALAAVMAPLWKRERNKLCNTISWPAEHHNCADA